jgi:hypothetical protein
MVDLHGIKPGDFIQLNQHFGDIFFEVISIFDVIHSKRSVTYYKYPKYSNKSKDSFMVVSPDQVRKIIPAEMAWPSMYMNRQRFHAKQGKYDPIDGFTANAMLSD